MLRKIWFIPIFLAAPVAAQAGNVSTAPAQFTVRIENVSKPTTLKSKTGETAPAPNSPGIWVVHRNTAPLFQVGKLDLGWGMEAQAEDGNPSALAEHCKSHEGVVAVGVFNTPKGDEQPGPALPGKVYEFTISASPGDRLSLATMFGQSNDLFYAPAERGIALFDGNGRPKGGDVSKMLEIWDAGTEVNEEPGFGPNQAPRQPGPNTGSGEKRPVRKVKDAYSYPKVLDVLKVTITPVEAMAG